MFAGKWFSEGLLYINSDYSCICATTIFYRKDKRRKRWKRGKRWKKERRKRRKKKKGNKIKKKNRGCSSAREETEAMYFHQFLFHQEFLQITDTNFRRAKLHPFPVLRGLSYLTKVQ